MRNMFKSIAVCGLILSAGPAMAETPDLNAIRANVMDCVSRMGEQTNWDQCRRLMFLPCEKEKVGSEKHLACLDVEKKYWGDLRQTYHTNVASKLTTLGNAMLVDLTGQWIGYVGQKCGDVGKQKAAISEDAARTGCEISEIVGISAELKACLDGRSTSPYCVIQD